MYCEPMRGWGRRNSTRRLRTTTQHLTWLQNRRRHLVGEAQPGRGRRNSIRRLRTTMRRLSWLQTGPKRFAIVALLGLTRATLIKQLRILLPVSTSIGNAWVPLQIVRLRGTASKNGAELMMIILWRWSPIPATGDYMRTGQRVW